jgi:hypothetical protein
MINLKVSTSQTLGAPGIYDVQVAGITLTLPNWGQWDPLGSIEINDETGSSNPNITVLPPLGGSIDGKTTVALSQANTSITFDPLTGGNTWTMSGYNQPSSYANSAITVAAPTAPASTSVYAMQGLAGSITPGVTGNVLVIISGTILAPAGTTVDNGILYQISYGTGVAPTANAVLTGTQVGLPQEFTLFVAATAAADVHVPFSITYLVTGLAIGTTYWVDLAAESVTTISQMGFANVSIVAAEQ